MNKLSLLDENNIFDAPVPGQSLTDTPKQWQWENPPEMTDPIEVYESIKESMNSPVARETIEKLLYVGVSVETIVNGLSLKGFSDGKFSPDVAELIKIPLAFQVTAIADRAGITPNIINEMPSKPMSDKDTIKLLKEFKPSEYNAIGNEILDNESMALQEEKEEQQQLGFMDMEMERGD